MAIAIVSLTSPRRLSLPIVVIALLPFTLAARQIATKSFQPSCELAKAVEALQKKYGYQVTNVQSTNSKRASTAAIPITDEENDSSYSDVVSIGTPQQNFNLVLDTGSFDLMHLLRSSTYKATSSVLEMDHSSGSALQVSSKIVSPSSPSKFSGTPGLAAIDTSTTPIGAPTPIAASIWAQVPGSTELSGDWQSLYAFPCDTTVIVHISFGGTNWTTSLPGMNLSTPNDTMISNTNSTSQMYVLTVSSLLALAVLLLGLSATPSRRMCTVSRARPAAAGFVQLASGLSSSIGSSDPNPVQATGLMPLPTSTRVSSSGSRNSTSG
ncbi:hypothetical protein EDB19DRAFT_1920554 [Suillus lakei]|nr:hypothetical protein EDB19DRAFT_1920554 [Suillus lakei]